MTFNFSYPLGKTFAKVEFRMIQKYNEARVALWSSPPRNKTKSNLRPHRYANMQFCPPKSIHFSGRSKTQCGKLVECYHLSKLPIIGDGLGGVSSQSSWSVNRTVKHAKDSVIYCVNIIHYRVPNSISFLATSGIPILGLIQSDNLQINTCPTKSIFKEMLLLLLLLLLSCCCHDSESLSSVKRVVGYSLALISQVLIISQ